MKKLILFILLISLGVFNVIGQSSPKVINDKQIFEKVIDSEEISVVEVYASFIKEKPNINDLTGCRKYSIKIETKECQEILSLIPSSSIPLVLIYKDGKLIKKYEGNILLELKVTTDEIQNYINGSR